MSRLGKKPIDIPDKVDIDIKDNKIVVKGPGGQLEQDIVGHVSVEREENSIIVKKASENKASNVNQGLMRTLIFNMIIGVTEGYKKELELVAREYKAVASGNGITLNLGYSNPVERKAPEGIQFEIPDEKHVIVKGIDKRLVGQVAADIRQLRRWEPYISKGIKYKGEQVRKKERKTGV